MVAGRSSRTRSLFWLRRIIVALVVCCLDERGALLRRSSFPGTSNRYATPAVGTSHYTAIRRRNKLQDPTSPASFTEAGLLSLHNGKGPNNDPDSCLFGFDGALAEAVFAGLCSYVANLRTDFSALSDLPLRLAYEPLQKCFSGKCEGLFFAISEFCRPEEDGGHEKGVKKTFTAAELEAAEAMGRWDRPAPASPPAKATVLSQEPRTGSIKTLRRTCSGCYFQPLQDGEEDSGGGARDGTILTRGRQEGTGSLGSGARGDRLSSGREDEDVVGGVSASVGPRPEGEALVGDQAGGERTSGGVAGVAPSEQECISRVPAANAAVPQTTLPRAPGLKVRAFAGFVSALMTGMSLLWLERIVTVARKLQVCCLISFHKIVSCDV